jgi:hypothetical protein
LQARRRARTAAPATRARVPVQPTAPCWSVLRERTRQVRWHAPFPSHCSSLDRSRSSCTRVRILSICSHPHLPDVSVGRAGGASTCPSCTSVAGFACMASASTSPVGTQCSAGQCAA